MILKNLTIILGLTGLGTFFVGQYITSLDFGSSPANSVNFHHTFTGTDIFIAPVGGAIIQAGVAILVAALVFGAAWYYRRAQTTRPANPR